MRQVTVEEAERNFHELLEAAREGEAVEITEAGVPVAKLVPSSETGEPAASNGSAAREDRGAPDEARARVLQPFPEGPEESGVLAALLDDRREAR